MPSFAFWNMQRFGGSSPVEKQNLYEGVVAQIRHDATDLEFIAFCEVTGNIKIGDADLSKALVKATKKLGQLAYEVIDKDLKNGRVERAEIKDFEKLFGIKSYKKGGNKFDRISKRPVAYVGKAGNTQLFIYHCNASEKAPFLVSWVAASLAMACNDDFILAGDLNCEPVEFGQTYTQILRQMKLKGSLVAPAKITGVSAGPTHNAHKKDMANTYDWAIYGAKTGEVKVQVIDYRSQIADMQWEDFNSDHLPIVVTHA